MDLPECCQSTNGSRACCSLVLIFLLRKACQQHLYENEKRVSATENEVGTTLKSLIMMHDACCMELVSKLEVITESSSRTRKSKTHSQCLLIFITNKRVVWLVMLLPCEDLPAAILGAGGCAARSCLGKVFYKFNNDNSQPLD